MCPGRSNGEVELVFGSVKMFLGLRAVALHIVVVGGASAIHLLDGFNDMLMDLI